MIFPEKQFGNYHVERELARGGYGTVYLARHTLLTDRLVAIKVLHDVHLQTPAERDAFLQEGQFLDRLKHPFILPLLDVGIQEQIPYLMMEYAIQGSLRSRLKARSPHPLPFDESLTMLSQIGQALQYAHQQTPAIIHRDLKPENILLNQRGEALLADFGIATVVSTASIRYTDPVGTAAYMAPEQFIGQVSRESDQYALGCVAYELLTGQTPFTAPNFIAMGVKHANEEPIPPTQHNPDLPAHVEDAVLKALAKQREDRHADVTAFIAALQGVPVSQEEEPLKKREEKEPVLPPRLNQSGDTSQQTEQDTVGSTAPLAQHVSRPSALAPLPSSVLRKRLISLALVLLLVLSGFAALFKEGQLQQQDAQSTATAIALNNAQSTADANTQSTADANVQSTADAQSTADVQSATATAQAYTNLYQQATSGIPILDDPLQQQSNAAWDVYQQADQADHSSCGFARGSYYVKQVTTGYFRSCDEHAYSFHNFAFQVTLTFINGDWGGIVFRADDTTSQQYLLSVNPSGQYSLTVFTGPSSNQGKGLLNGTTNDVGTSGSTEITLIAKDNTFYFYVNRNFVDSTTDSTITSGLIGLAAESDQQSTEVAFNNVKVWQL